MHLPRLWTDAPVVMKTQVNRCKEGQTRQEEPLVGPTGAKRAQLSGQGGPDNRTEKEAKKRLKIKR